MLFHLRAERTGNAYLGLVQHRHIRRWRRRRGVEHRLQKIFAAQHNRRPRGVAGYRQHTGLREDPAALSGGQFHAPELRPGHAGNAVVFGQQFIQERVLAIDEVADGPVLAHHRFEEHARLGPHGILQFGSPFGEELGIGLHGVQAAGLQPLSAEVLRERRGLGVGDHALHLRVQYIRLVQLVGFAQAQQFVVGNGTPQEEAQARSEFRIADGRNGAGFGIALDAEQKLRRHQHRGNGKLQALRGCVPGRRRLAVNLQKLRHFGLGRRAAVGVMRKVGENAGDAGGPRRRVAGQDLLLRGMRVRRGKRPGNLDAVREDIAAGIGPEVRGNILQGIVIDELRPERVLAAWSETDELPRCSAGWNHPAD